MGNVKNEYKKYGKASLYCVLIEDKINNLCNEYNIKLENNNRFISLPEKIDMVKSSEEMKKNSKRNMAMITRKNAENLKKL